MRHLASAATVLLLAGCGATGPAGRTASPAPDPSRTVMVTYTVVGFAGDGGGSATYSTQGAAGTERVEPRLPAWAKVETMTVRQRRTLVLTATAHPDPGFPPLPVPDLQCTIQIDGAAAGTGRDRGTCSVHVDVDPAAGPASGSPSPRPAGTA